METSSLRVFFYLPIDKDVPLPESIDNYWDWQKNLKTPQGFLWGRYHWVAQTYLFLKAAGVDCLIVRELPSEGIVVSHIDYFSADYFPKTLKPNKKLFLISMLVDRKFAKNPFSNLYVVHNPLQDDSKKFFYISPWPQINLIPRDCNRGERFENIAYYGRKGKLPRELYSDSFKEKMDSLGLNFIIKEPNQWNDYSEVDAVIAFRGFNLKNIYKDKPALKLINCWKAGVPSVLGCESAYRIIGEKNKDYLEAKSPEEIIRCLGDLKSDIKLRRKIIENGTLKYKDYDNDKVVSMWKDFLSKAVFPAYHNWRKNTSGRGYFLLFSGAKGHLSVAINRINKKIYAAEKILKNKLAKISHKS